MFRRNLVRKEVHIYVDTEFAEPVAVREKASDSDDMYINLLTDESDEEDIAMLDGECVSGHVGHGGEVEDVAVNVGLGGEGEGVAVNAVPGGDGEGVSGHERAEGDGEGVAGNAGPGGDGEGVSGHERAEGQSEGEGGEGDGQSGRAGGDVEGVSGGDRSSADASSGGSVGEEHVGEAVEDDEVMSNYQSDNHVGPDDGGSASGEEEYQGPSDPMWAHINERGYDTDDEDDWDFNVGMTFDNVGKFRQALRDFSVKKGFELLRMKNEKSRVTVKCAAVRCTWRIHATPMTDGVTYVVKTYVSGHSCERVGGEAEASSTWMASKLVDLIRENPNIRPRGIRHELAKYNLDPPYMQIYRAKMKALDLIEGSHGQSYGQLPFYCEMVRRTNIGSVMRTEFIIDEQEVERPGVPRPPMFKRIFVGLAALRDNFLQGIPPFLAIDGCHLKGPYGGVLLAAVGVDGNSGLFPLAWAVVETEDQGSWGFFLSCLGEMLGGFGEDRPWTFMSDRQTV